MRRKKEEPSLGTKADRLTEAPKLLFQALYEHMYREEREKFTGQLLAASVIQLEELNSRYTGLEKFCLQQIDLIDKQAREIAKLKAQLKKKK